SYAEAQERCTAYVAESRALSIHPYDAAETIAGQGTLALEWEEDLERLGLEKLDTVLIAVGGGGLISGLAAWFAGRVRVVGVEPEGSRALHDALEAGAPVDVAVIPDEAIVAAQRRLWTEASIVAEPGGAAALAALASGAWRPAKAERVG